MSNAKDYFIKDSGISAYTINAFVEAIVEATKAGYKINYDSARRISTSFCVNFKEGESTVEAQAPAQEEAPESPETPEEPAEEPAGQPEGESEESSVEQPFTLADIEAAESSMAALNELAEPVGISGRSKKDVAAQLREYIGA